ncbi:hypothetical protein TNCV_4233881 [Trichonephila clavipes]|nr:hypothetical protein TNCV_4233881 [Trichonephila clavipes]
MIPFDDAGINGLTSHSVVEVARLMEIKEELKDKIIIRSTLSAIDATQRKETVMSEVFAPITLHSFKPSSVLFGSSEDTRPRNSLHWRRIDYNGEFL